MRGDQQMNIGRSVLLAGAIASFLALPSRAAEIHVPAQAPTIQEAIDRANDGDIIRIAPGLYPENLVARGKMITLSSTSCPQNTVVFGGRRGSTLQVESPGIRIDGLTIAGGLAEQGGGILISTGLVPGPPIDVELGRVILQANEAQEGGGGLAVVSYVPGTPVIVRLENSLLFNNRAERAGAILLESNLPGGILHVLMVNCTVADNRAVVEGAGLAVQGEVLSQEPGGPLTFNTIFWNNRLESDEVQDLFNLEEGAVRFSNISDGQFAGEDGNISEDPLFRNAPLGDYRLLPESPCIDAGVSAVGGLVAPDLDFQGSIPVDDPDVPNLNGGIQEMGYVDNTAPFIRGDADGNTLHDVSDAIYTFNYLFLGGGESCLASMDSNDDERLDISAGIFTLTFLFLGGAPYSPPYPFQGLDPTKGADPLPCRNYPVACWPPE